MLAMLAKRADSLLIKCVDAGLAGVLFVVPMMMGGRIAAGQLVLITLSLWVAVCWCLRQCLAPRAAWVRSPAGPLMLVALVLAAVQFMPLSPSLLAAISPKLAKTLPLWTSGVEGTTTIDVWSTLSLTPAATRDSFIVLLAFALLLLTTLQRLRQVEDVERLLRWVAVAALAMAGFGLIQHFTRNGKYFWFYQYPFASTNGRVAGSFTNRNHFAQFIALGIGPLIWWLQSEWRSKRTRNREITVGLLAIGLGVAVFAVLMALSRGGSAALLVAAVVCLIILYRGSLVGRNTLLTVAGVGLLVVASLSIYGYEAVARRLDDFGSVRELNSGGRLRLWRADAEVIADYPLAGTGLGSHRAVCPMYLHDATNAVGLEYTHAENGYVQVAMESGVPGLLLALAAVGLCVFWCVSSIRGGDPPQNPRVLLCFAAIAASLAANFLHAIVDFVWYVPGVMVVVVVLAACACRLWQLSRGKPREAARVLWIPRGGWMAATVCLVVVGALMVHNRLIAARAEPFWHRCLVLGRNLANHEAPDRPEKLNAMLENLSATVRWEPDRARAHAWLAAVHLGLFDEPQNPSVAAITVKQLSDTVAHDPQLQSPDALDAWLSRAFPERRRHLDAALHHARTAVALCPLLGENYLFLADLSFLAGSYTPRRAAFVDQALIVRPFDGSVLFAAGQEAAMAGKPEEAVQFWQRSARTGPAHQRRLAKVLIGSGRLPADVVLDIVQPDVPTLRWIRWQYHKLGRKDELSVFDERLAAASQAQARTSQGESACGYWLEAAKAYRRLQRSAESLRCLRRAVESDFSQCAARYELGTLLLELREFDEAEKHLRWCLQRKPRDEEVRRQLEAAIDGRLKKGDMLLSRPVFLGTRGVDDTTKEPVRFVIPRQ